MNCMLHTYKIQSCVNTKQGATQTHKACFQSHKIQSNNVIKYINKIQQDATVCRYLFTANLLYMFQVSIAPIIRST